MFPTDVIHDPEDNISPSYASAPFLVTPPHRPNFSEQIEETGIRIEEALRSCQCRYQACFFVASALAVAIAAILGFKCLFQFRLITAYNLAVLCVAAAAAGVLDAPGNPRWAAKHRYAVRRNCRILTRLAGRSLFYVYLGCALWCIAWPGFRHSQGKAVFISIASFIIIVIGKLGCMIAWRKSVILDRVRREIMSETNGNVSTVYKKHAFADPDMGLQYEEFNRLAQNYSRGRISFDLSDLSIIFNALDEDHKAAISERELREWVNGRIVFL